MGKTLAEMDADCNPLCDATSVADGDTLALSAIGGGEWMPGEPRPIAPAPAEPHGTFSADMHTHLTGIDATLAGRGTRYGEFIDQARIAVGIKKAMACGRNWGTLESDQRECLDMLANKIARILNGDPNYHDSWHDIVGYAKLVADRLAA